MPFVAFQLRMRAAAARKLTLIGALRAADWEGPDGRAYIESLHRQAGIVMPGPVFALVQSSNT